MFGHLQEKCKYLHDSGITEDQYATESFADVLRLRKKKVDPTNKGSNSNNENEDHLTQPIGQSSNPTQMLSWP